MIESIIQYKTDTSNMLNDLTEVRPSPIAGLGLFAKVFIPKNTIWWCATPRDILLIARDQYEMLKDSAHSSFIKAFQDTILIYSYYVREYDALVFCCDNAKYVNHSYNPNSGETPDCHPFASMALRDIYPGEEILENYKAYDQCSWIDVKEDFL